MVSRFGIVLVLLLTVVFLFAPVMVLGQGLPSQIVPCDGPNCRICDIAVLAQNVLNTAIFFAVIFSAFIFAWAGWTAMTAGGNAEQVGKARTMFTKVIIGLVIILAGWVVIDTLMKSVTDEAKFGPWNKICQEVLSHFEHFYA